MNSARAELDRRLNYRFANPRLLERALTHRSYGGVHYERLEFLGDSVLNLAISTDLYRRFPELSEGDLTRLRASLVKQETLAGVARALKLGDCLALGGGEIKSGGFDRDSILADALEAIFGAVYVDGGINAAERLILDLYASILERLDARAVPKDPKTQLQELLQKQALPIPAYSVVATTGDPHHQMFTVECQAPGLAQPTRGNGSTRRNAEQEAAAEALRLLSPP